jgi:acyl-CoA dehydrogenase
VSALRERGLPEATPRRQLPPFTDAHERLREEVRRFVANELRPQAREWEDARWFPSEVFSRMAELACSG